MCKMVIPVFSFASVFGLRAVAEDGLRLCHGHPLHSQFPMIHSSTFSYLFLISHYHQFIMSSIFSMNNLLIDYLSFASLTVCAF